MKTILKQLSLLCIGLLFFSFTTVAQENWEISLPEGSLSGSFMAAPPNKKVVIIIPGSGPVDRDGNSGKSLQSNSYAMLAEQLAQADIASLRFDKRGVGKSVFENLQEDSLRIENFADDVVLWINKIKETLSDSTHIYLLGHSEGSLIAAMVAQKVAVDGIISAAGAGKSAAEILKEQFAKQPISLREDANVIIDSLVQGYTVNLVNPYLQSVFRPSVQPYLISWFVKNPAEIYQQLSCPKLFLQGDADLQVSPQEVYLLSADSTQIHLVENMNHLMKQVQNQDENIDSYINPKYPLSEKMMKILLQFITTTP
ncbi:MAG: alpha/beta fold hydrolase [Chitinophagales bacterium]|nr:alpha/beta fold hydrolase [Bacteroidota bacterium]